MITSQGIGGHELPDGRRSVRGTNVSCIEQGLDRGSVTLQLN